MGAASALPTSGMQLNFPGSSRQQFPEDRPDALIASTLNQDAFASLLLA